MLLSLHVENIAVIKSIDIDFSSGFTALTGGTGAGKSIIIASIKLLLGAKAERDLIRNGEDFCLVSGLFGDFSASALEILAEFGVYADEENNILIQRRVSLDGKSQIKINGRAVSISVLKSVSTILVNIHGQSDTHALTDSKTHIAILDSFSGNGELLSEYHKRYTEYNEIRTKIREISEKERERERLLEMYEYQVKDIDALDLHDGEEEELIDKKLKLKNSERISKSAGFVFKALKGSEKGSVSFLLDKSITQLTSLSDVIPHFAEYAEHLRDFLYQIDDIAEDVYTSIDDVDVDPTEKLNNIESRLDKISKIKRKYGLTIAEVLSFRERAAADAENLRNSAEVLSSLERQLAESYKSALEIADKLHERRASATKQLEVQIKETLEFLDMPKVVFFASIREEYNSGEKILSPRGYDNVEFYISANLGSEPKPLAKIASGGELARIMLAIKSVIAATDGVTTIVFDEIDAGVSGKTARKIGIKLLSLSNTIQVFAVTHSAQIASLSDLHILISKSDVSGKTETSVTELDYDGRILELSRILGGINITDAQKQAAIDMLGEREIYKPK